MRISFAALALGFLALADSAPLKVRQTSPDFSKVNIVAFGDSLTDNGNTFALTNKVWPTPQIYWQGRYSNGPTWIEYVGSSLGVKTINKAYGGSSTDSGYVLGEAPDGVQIANMPGLVQQVDQFLTKEKTTAPARNTIVSVWSGANDYFRAAAYSRTDITPATVVGKTMSAINTLAKNGYKYLVVFNLPPGSPYIPADAHNAELKKQLDAFTAANKDVKVLSIDMLSTLISSGLVALDNSRGCVDPTTGTICSNPDLYLTWDGVHPTTKVHEELAEQVKKAAFDKIQEMSKQ